MIQSHQSALFSQAKESAIRNSRIMYAAVSHFFLNTIKLASDQCRFGIVLPQGEGLTYINIPPPRIQPHQNQHSLPEHKN